MNSVTNRKIGTKSFEIFFFISKLKIPKLTFEMDNNSRFIPRYSFQIPRCRKYTLKL